MGNSVKVIPGDKELASIINRSSTRNTNNAKSGLNAERLAGLRDEDKNRNPKIIKVSSAAARTTAGVTPKTSTVAKLFRPSRGGGIGGIMGNKQR
jgi:hypothetical protein